MPRSDARILERYQARLEAIRADAEADGLFSLEYLVTMARLEAERLIEQGNNEHSPGSSFRGSSRWRSLEDA